MKGKLIAIEGVDSSGKETHTEMLYNRLLNENCRVIKVRFPDYESQSSALVKMYLNGEFGEKPEDVNPYASSSFYAVDRFASYKTAWEDFYLSGGTVIADRYTTSNMIHQASKIKDETERKKYLEWLWDFEFVKLGIPVPDCVIFLDMPPEYAQKLMEHRKNKFTGKAQKDIHEKSSDHLRSSYDFALSIAGAYHWNRVPCVEDGRIRSFEEIHEDIYRIVRGVLSGT